MKEIVVISGKGGTGKTSITASFAKINGEKALTADCDVDAADMHLLLQPDFDNKKDFYSGQLAYINPEKCINCFKCKKACHFDAVEVINDTFQINELNCEGCGYCYHVCPSQAITMKDALAGETYLSKTRMGTTLAHAALGIGADNSGKLVTQVKTMAEKEAEKQQISYILVDGTPGIGCPVTASVTGANYVVIVTEPSLSGQHDLERAYELVKNFSIPAGCIINKNDLNPDVTKKIKSWAKENGIKILAEIPYNENFVKSLTDGMTVIEYDEELSELIHQAWDNIVEEVGEL